MSKDAVFKALADPTRRLILDEFTEREEQTLYELTVRLAMKHKLTMSRPAIVKHVGILESAGLLRSERRGKYRFLILNNKPTIKMQPSKPARIKIILTSIFVDDQDKALEFYTEKLGFIKKYNTSMGEHKWITVVSPDDPEGTELLLEPSENQAIQDYKRGLSEEGIPAAMFGVSNIDDEYQRLTALGVEFVVKPTQMDSVKIAILDDTCGNLIQLIERKG
ncbi:MAG TPA: VOC family protein [Verrucomicrobiae bacterium]|nr:VOC family protein [Verrucomicrobiae bacterium]